MENESDALTYVVVFVKIIKISLEKDSCNNTRYLSKNPKWFSLSTLL